MSITLTCGGCTNTWSGSGRCHCAGCHRTFSGRVSFDSHRDQYGPRGRCLDPATLDLELFDGYWRRAGQAEQSEDE